jgi:hypothetical protein
VTENASGAGGPPASSEPVISGGLSETPLFVVLRRIQREHLSGTLSVFRSDQVRQLVFEQGELYAARSSREEHRIGATLVRWGYISEADLQNALLVQKTTHQRIDSILVEKGLVTRLIVDSEARRQMEQIVFSTMSWPDGSFHFEKNTGPVELDVASSFSQEMIVEGIRRIPESEQFLELLGDLSGVPTLTRDPMSSGSLRLLRDAVGLIAQIDGRCTLRQLMDSSSVPGSAIAKILYSLLFAGIIEVRPSTVQAAFSSRPPAGRMTGAAAPVPAAGPPTGERRETADRRQGDRRASERAEPEKKRSAYLYDMREKSEMTRAAESGSPGQRGDAGPAPQARPGDLRSPREIVLDMHRKLDWLSHYDLLGVSRRATRAEIEDAFRERSRLFDPSLKAHPELVDCWRQLTVLAKWLRVAHGVLSNPESRAAYDEKIDQATEKTRSPL